MRTTTGQAGFPENHPQTEVGSSRQAEFERIVPRKSRSDFDHGQHQINQFLWIPQAKSGGRMPLNHASAAVFVFRWIRILGDDSCHSALQIWNQSVPCALGGLWGNASRAFVLVGDTHCRLSIRRKMSFPSTRGLRRRILTGILKTVASAGASVPGLKAEKPGCNSARIRPGSRRDSSSFYGKLFNAYPSGGLTQVTRSRLETGEIPS